MDLNKFNTLEIKIKELVEGRETLKTRAEELVKLLGQKESELRQAYEKIRELDEEREAIRTKVDSLLDLLKDIKLSQ